MMRNRLLLVGMVLLGVAAPLAAQVPGPPPPKEYQVQIRYRIQAARNERLRQFFPMLEFFESLGFKKQPGPDDEPEDAYQNRMSGTIPSASVRRLFEEPHVKSVLLLPPDYKLPEDDDASVKVQLELAGGLPPAQQRLLSEQVRARLGAFGFREAIAYDHRGFTRLVGTVRAGDVELLARDIRSQPAGWLAPADPVRDLPAPLRMVEPIRVTEVIPEPAGVDPIRELASPDIPKGQEHLLKLTPELRALLANADEAAKPTRLEVILAATPSADSRSWQQDLTETVPQLVIEGRLGPLVTIVVPADKTPLLSPLAIVSTIRLPRSGAPLPLPATDARGRNSEVLKQSGLARLHALGQRGKGVRVGVIAGDFRGYQELVKNKQLPAATRVLDLTVQRNVNLEPEPYPEDGAPLGHGTLAARAVALAAPDADLLLIRVDPTCPYMVYDTARHINGLALDSLTLDERRAELDVSFDELKNRWRDLLRERRELQEDFSALEEAVQKRAAHAKKMKELKDEETAYQERLARFLRHQGELRELTRLQVVVNTLVWPEGHAVDGSSPLTRYLNNQPFRTTLWFAPAGDTHGQSWTGAFHDKDSNGIMEFAPPSAHPLGGEAKASARWTPELNFLAWQPFGGKQETELPAKATIRLSLQWREPHDPEFLRRGEDFYREPLARLQLLLLRQRDPSYAKLAADDMELVARSFGLPQRLDNQPTSATYEITLDFSVDNPGRYALRLDGRVPTGIRPPDAPSVSVLDRSFEPRLRLFVEVLDPQSRAIGRAVLLDYATNEGAIGMPSDSIAALTVGAIGKGNALEPYSAIGPPMNLQLMIKPQLLSFDGLELTPGEQQGTHGTSISASFAAGLAASMLSAGISPRTFLPAPEQPAALFRVPANQPVRRAAGR